MWPLQTEKTCKWLEVHWIDFIIIVSWFCKYNDPLKNSWLSIFVITHSLIRIGLFWQCHILTVIPTVLTGTSNRNPQGKGLFRFQSYIWSASMWLGLLYDNACHIASNFYLEVDNMMINNTKMVYHRYYIIRVKSNKSFLLCTFPSYNRQ